MPSVSISPPKTSKYGYRLLDILISQQRPLKWWVSC